MKDQIFDPDSGFGIQRICELLPHRYPFLLIDRVVGIQLEPRKVISAIKNVTFNEPFFPGHFPNHPVMPGVLMIEAMAQTAGIITMLMQEQLGQDTHQFYLAKVDNTKFHRLVQPGDQLHIFAEQKRTIRSMGIYAGEIWCGDEPVASAEFMCAARS